MRSIFELLKAEPRARVFFAVLAQSSLGTGAAHVGLLLIAYERFESPWSLSFVLMADLLPAMFLGPIFGALADRWSRRGCMALADVVRGAAFIGIAFVDSFEATLALALAAGIGTGMFTPAALAALPGLARPSQLPASTSLYSAITDFGFTAGPGLAGVILLVGQPETILAGNGVTFVVSAIVLAGMSFGAVPPNVEPRPALFPSARAGLETLTRSGLIRTVLLASTAVLFFGGLLNVAELPFAKDDLEVGAVGFSVLVAVCGLGVIAGSVFGSRGGDDDALKRNFTAGLLLMAVGLIACGLSFSLVTAILAFTAFGVGNGLVLVHERILIQRTLPDALLGRVFGAKDALTAWAFALSFLAAGALVSAIGPRAILLAAGAGGLVVWVIARVALQRPQPSSPLPRGSGQAEERVATGS